jgi:hypothetical protein
MTDEKLAPRRQSLPLGVLVRQTPGVTRWARQSWRAVGVLPGAGPGGWRELSRVGEVVEFHAATVTLELHKSECEAYATALAADPPLLWVVSRHPGGNTALRPEPLLVTASAYLAQDHCDNGEDVVDPVPMPQEVASWVAAFVEAHFQPETFRKRKRRPHLEAQAEDGVGDARVRQAADVYRAPASLKARS